MEVCQHEVVSPNQGLLSFLYVHNGQETTYIEPHWHRAVELSYTSRGSIDHFYIAGENFQTTSGQILVVNTQDVHSIRVLNYKKEPELALTIIYPYPFLVGQCNTINHCQFDINHPETFSEEQKQAYKHLQDILEGIILDFQTDNLHKNNRLQIAERIKEIDNFLQQNYQEDIGLEELADYCHLSRSYMARFFKSHLGVTLGQYLGTIRAQKARDSLIETKDRFTDIALEHGFSGLRSMNRALETNFGKTARQLREEQ